MSVTLSNLRPPRGSRHRKVRVGRGIGSKLGKTVAERSLAAGVQQVVFDRGGYMYHGRVQALASAAREAGLKF